MPVTGWDCLLKFRAPRTNLAVGSGGFARLYEGCIQFLRLMRLLCGLYTVFFSHKGFARLCMFCEAAKVCVFFLQVDVNPNLQAPLLKGVAMGLRIAAVTI